MKKLNEQNKPFLACERLGTFILLIFAGGVFGAFSYIERGGVFCSAQTLNLLLAGVNVGKGNFFGALYYLLPIAAYFVGIILSEILPKPLRRMKLLRWDTLLVGIEIAAVAVLAIIPDSAPYQISHVILNVVTAMQYNTFRQAEGEVMSTTFCTFHMRQTGEAFVRWTRGSKSKNWKRIALSHLVMIISFAAGGGVFAALCTLVGGRAILVSLIPLVCVFVYLVCSDLGKEKESFDRVPRGH